MATWLKQSTAADVMLGPFLDSSDGNTTETALTITQPDIRLSKNGGAFAQKSAAQTLTHGENGWYPANLSTTDTNTLGVLIVAVHESGALPVWREFMVVTAQVWDSLFGADLLQVDLTQWLGVAPLALTSQQVQVQTNTLGAGIISAAALATDSGLKPAQSGTCEAVSTSTTVALNSTASSVTDFYKGSRIYLTGGTGAGQSRICTAYNGTTKIATIEPAWITTPGNGTSTFAVRDDASTSAIATGGITPASFAANAINDATLATDMDAYHAKVWIVKESTTADHYAVVFFKNGQPVTSGITSPTIQVIKASDGSDLIASGALTEVSALGIYKKDESTNQLVAGAIYFAKVTASIDGSTRVWLQQIGRDSA